MADKLRDTVNQRGEQWVAFHCPGCERGHSIPVTGVRAWKWNGSLEKPTITPSILVNVGGTNPTQPICHSVVTDGKIVFLSDCTHKLAGQTIEIPDWN
jgi:hypothetical protein